MKPIKEKRISSNSVALAGEFAALSRLALWGYDANMTLGRTKSVDILASHPETNKFYRLEVKTKLSGRKRSTSFSKLFGRSVCDWIMHEKHESIAKSDLWYCFVMIGLRTKETRFFIVPSALVAKYVKREHSLWLRESRAHKDSPMRLFRIGVKGEKYRVPTPAMERYEDNWEFRK